MVGVHYMVGGLKIHIRVTDCPKYALRDQMKWSETIGTTVPHRYAQRKDT